MSSERRDNASSNTSTEQLPGSEGGAPPPTQRGVTILVYHSDGVASKQLAPGEALVVGRSDSADLSIPDSALSREHARFTFVDGRVQLEDLGSRNGTYVAGERIDRTDIGFSGEAMLGWVAIARVVAFGITGEPALDSYETFRRRLDEEVTRAKLSDRSFAVLAVRANDAEAKRASTGAWAAQLRANLRSFDRVNLDTPDVALILLPETRSDVALDVARAVASGASDQGGARLYSPLCLALGGGARLSSSEPGQRPPAAQ